MTLAPDRPAELHRKNNRHCSVQQARATANQKQPVETANDGRQHNRRTPAEKDAAGCDGRRIQVPCHDERSSRSRNALAAAIPAPIKQPTPITQYPSRKAMYPVVLSVGSNVAMNPKIQNASTAGRIKEQRMTVKSFMSRLDARFVRKRYPHRQIVARDYFSLMCAGQGTHAFEDVVRINHRWIAARVITMT